MHTRPPPSLSSFLRLGYAVLFGAGVAAAVVVAGAGAWQVWTFLVAPDVALVLGVGRGLERGQLHPRAVPLYNAFHRVLGPVGLALASAWLGPEWLAGAFAWGAHVALDRALGFGLRTREGFQRAA